MNTHRFFALFFVTTVISATLLSAHPKRIPLHCKELSMEKAVHLALHNRASMRALPHLLHAKKYNEKMIWFSYFPSISLSTEGAKTKSRSEPLTETTFTVEQLIFDPAGPQTHSRKIKTEIESLELQQKKQQHDVRRSVESLFLDSWRLQQQYKSIAALHKATKYNITKSNNIHTVEISNKHEWLTEMEAHAHNFSSVSRYYDALKNASKQLMFATGNKKQISLLPINKEASTTLCWNDKQLILKPLRCYQQQAFAFRPEIKDAQKKIEIKKQDEIIHAREQLPKIFAKAEATHVRSLGNSAFRARSDNSIGAKITWNMFDHARSNIQSAQAHSERIAAQLAKQEIIQQINAEVESAYYALSQSISTLKSIKFKYLRAQNEFVLRKKELEVGTLSPVDFKQATSSWQATSFEWINQRTEVAKKHRELLYRCGYPTKNVIA